MSLSRPEFEAIICREWLRRGHDGPFVGGALDTFLVVIQAEYGDPDVGNWDEADAIEVAELLLEEGAGPS